MPKRTRILPRRRAPNSAVFDADATCDDEPPLPTTSTKSIHVGKMGADGLHTKSCCTSPNLPVSQSVTASPVKASSIHGALILVDGAHLDDDQSGALIANSSFYTKREYAKSSINYRFASIDLQIAERIAREDIIFDETSALDALLARNNTSREAVRAYRGAAHSIHAPGSRARVLANSHDHKWNDSKRESEFIEEGRIAWKEQVAADARRAQEEKRRLREQHRNDIELHRALTYVVVQECRSRMCLCDEEEVASRRQMILDEQIDRAAAAQLEYIRFLESPEQVAARAEMDRQTRIAARRVERQERAHRAEQEKFVRDCHHGRNGQSLLTLPGLRVCGKCRVRYDAEKNCLVRMDATTSKRPAMEKATVNTHASKQFISPAPQTEAAATKRQKLVPVAN